MCSCCCCHLRRWDVFGFDICEGGFRVLGLELVPVFPQHSHVVFVGKSSLFFSLSLSLTQSSGDSKVQNRMDPLREDVEGFRVPQLQRENREPGASRLEAAT